MPTSSVNFVVIYPDDIKKKILRNRRNFRIETPSPYVTAFVTFEFILGSLLRSILARVSLQDQPLFMRKM